MEPILWFIRTIYTYENSWISWIHRVFTNSSGFDNCTEGLNLFLYYKVIRPVNHGWGGWRYVINPELDIWTYPKCLFPFSRSVTNMTSDGAHQIVPHNIKGVDGCMCIFPITYYLLVFYESYIIHLHCVFEISSMWRQLSSIQAVGWFWSSFICQTDVCIKKVRLIMIESID